jgi:hypothetical protein
MMGAGSPDTAAVTALLLVGVAALLGAASAGDIVHQDDDAPKIPGCSNDFMLVRAFLTLPPPPFSSSEVSCPDSRLRAAARESRFGRALPVKLAISSCRFHFAANRSAVA